MELGSLVRLFNNRKVTLKTLKFTADLLVLHGRDYFDRAELALMRLIQTRSVTIGVLQSMLRGTFNGTTDRLTFEIRCNSRRSRHITQWFGSLTTATAADH